MVAHFITQGKRTKLYKARQVKTFGKQMNDRARTAIDMTKTAQQHGKIRHK